ncbi:MAG TPA: hypothetical protein VHY36_02685 [Steroidobacteraceae bacterium]|jgi:hypothetical protein|nr:hypothetical protein [Steroidobacteraceae bacterium]
MKSKSAVHGFFEKNGILHVAFRVHDGYFQVPLADATLCAKIRASRDGKTEISFTFDRDLKILTID